MEYKFINTKFLRKKRQRNEKYENTVLPLNLIRHCITFRMLCLLICCRIEYIKKINIDFKNKMIQNFDVVHPYCIKLFIVYMFSQIHASALRTCQTPIRFDRKISENETYQFRCLTLCLDNISFCINTDGQKD